MFSTTCEGIFHGWLRYEALDAAERRWLEQAVELGIRFGRERCHHVACQGVDVAIVGRAAEVLWAANPCAPHWRDLDAEPSLAHIERMCGKDLRYEAVASLVAFTQSLVASGKITSDEALVVRSRFDRFVAAEMIAAGYQPTAVPSRLWPS